MTASYLRFLLYAIAGLSVLGLMLSGTRPTATASGTVAKRALVMYGYYGTEVLENGQIAYLKDGKTLFGNDAKEIGDLLKAMGWTVNGGGANPTFLLFPKNDKDLKSKILLAFGQPQQGTSKDLLLFYYSGHGGVASEKDDSQERDEQGLNDLGGCPIRELHDDRCDETLADRFAMKDDDLAKWFKDRAYPGRKIFVLDSCASGGFLDGTKDLNTVPNTYVLTASTAEEKSQGQNFWNAANHNGHSRHGIFSLYLIEELKGAGPNHGGDVTLNDLFSFVKGQAGQGGFDVGNGGFQNPVSWPAALPDDIVIGPVQPGGAKVPLPNSERAKKCLGCPEGDLGLVCDFNGTYDIVVTFLSNTHDCTDSEILLDTCTGNGAFIHCKAIASHTKIGTQQPLSWRLACYWDSTLAVVNAGYPEVPYDGTRPEGSGNPANSCSNTLDDDGDGKVDSGDSDCHVTTCPPAPAGMCGDGFGYDPPPGCVNGGDATRCASNTQVPNCSILPCPTTRYVYLGIDSASYPTIVTDQARNYYDTSDNKIHLGGCFGQFGSTAFGNVYIASTIHAQTGAGLFSMYFNQTLADCQNGTPQGMPIDGDIELSKLQSNVDSLGNQLPDNQLYDSDGDGCADKRELGDTASGMNGGGLRDPWNSWDYFNPEKVNTPHQQTVADILKVVGQFGKHQGNIAYDIGTDRTGLLGGQAWNLGPPDGQQTVADILAAVKQFGHNCPYVFPGQ